MIPEIRIEDYNYSLPDERIAKYPLPQRDGSKLLKYKAGVVSEHRFVNIADLLPEGSMMVFNDTKVVSSEEAQADASEFLELLKTHQMVVVTGDGE